MAKREWIGDYWIKVEEFKTYKEEWVTHTLKLGYCRGEQEASERAVATIMREFPTSQIRNARIINGWGRAIKA